MFSPLVFLAAFGLTYTLQKFGMGSIHQLYNLRVGCNYVIQVPPRYWMNLENCGNSMGCFNSLWRFISKS